MKTLIIAEHDNVHLKTTTLAAIAAAEKLSQPIEVIVVGASCQAVASELQTLKPVTKVIVADNAVYQHQLAENVAPLLQAVIQAQSYNHVIVPASTFGKDLLPRLAGLLQVNMASDVTEIIDSKTVTRPIYAGNALAKVVLNDAIKLISIRSSAFSSDVATQTELAPIESCDLVFNADKTKFISRQETKSARPELGQAKIIISGGRGLQSKENFALIEQLADKLNAAVGASRAAVDAGFVPNDYQVGQTGKIVAPELYIAIGISGAIQHLAGMKDSRVIVAINKDPEAPIFQIADYGLVGDLFTVIPELLAKLS